MKNREALEARYSVVYKRVEGLIFDANAFVPKELADEKERLEKALGLGQDSLGPCRWFALCDRLATTTTPHPILGKVPTCPRCADFAEGRAISESLQRESDFFREREDRG